jgi:Ca2+-binding RTX toxin-like protein
MSRPPRGQIYDFSDDTDGVRFFYDAYRSFDTDTLIGGAGNDDLFFSGHDRVTGGKGADRFVLVTDFNDNGGNAERFPQAVATITDFSLEGGDTITFGYYSKTPDPSTFTAVYLEEKNKTIITVDNNGEVDRIRLLGGDFTDDIGSIFT